MVTGFLWFMAGFILFGVGATVAEVGQPRKPITPAVATVSILLNTLLVTCIVLILTGAVKV